MQTNPNECRYCGQVVEDGWQFCSRECAQEYALEIQEEYREGYKEEEENQEES